MSNLISNFIIKIFIVEFLSNFKVVELEFEFEPGDLDSGASRHMTEARELFNNLSEEKSKLHIELGNNAKYAVRG
jgi:hypothetical protein